MSERLWLFSGDTVVVCLADDIPSYFFLILFSLLFIVIVSTGYSKGMK